MKIIAVWPDDSPHTGLFLEDMQKRGHEIVYWVGEYADEHRLTPKGAVFHGHYEAWEGKPAPAYENTSIPPAPSALIEKMYRVESVALTMMNKGYNEAPVDSRKHSYYSMLAYWTFVLDALKPEAVVYNTVPHTVYAYVLYELARARSIRTITIDSTWFLARSLCYEDIWNGNATLRTAIAENLKKGVDLEDLEEASRGFYERLAKESVDVHPSTEIMKGQQTIAEGAGLVQHRMRIALETLRRGTFFSLAWEYLKRIFEKDLRDEYLSVQKEPDLSIPFVYYPLSHQPERTTSPQGGIYHDQILLAETVAAALPDGWKLYIKEHPSQWWRRSKTRYSSVRYSGYYRRMARIPNAVLVPITTDTRTLSKASRTTVTVTGTAGWESLMRGKPPLIFGFVWYMDCPGVYRVASVDDCKRAFAELVQNPIRETKKGIFAFLKAVEQVSPRAQDGDYSFDPVVPHIPIEESLRALAEKFDALLRGKDSA